MKRLTQILLLGLLALCICSCKTTESTLSSKSKQEVFDYVSSYVSRTYYDPDFGGNDWDAINERYRGKLGTIRSAEALRSLLRKMLNELGQSHFAIVPQNGAELANAKEWGGAWAEMRLCLADKGLLACEVIEGGAAWDAGIRNGDLVTAIGGQSVRSIFKEVAKSGVPEHLVPIMSADRAMEKLWGWPSSSVALEARSPNGAKRSLKVALATYNGRLTQSFGNLPEMPFSLESKIIDGDIAYLSFNLWFPAAMSDIRPFISNLDDDLRGLIIDLRGNPGGIGIMAGGLAGLLVDEQTMLGTTRMREGHINFVGFPQKGAFLGPVAVLIDELSGSTSEIFAIGMQEAGRARVFGRASAGAALPSVFTMLPNGDLLQSVMGDFTTPRGTSLEARGVIPDEIVPISAHALAAGEDATINAAIDWILNEN